MTHFFDLGIAWEWQHDRDFAYSLDKECQKSGVSSYIIYPANLEETLGLQEAGRIAFRMLIDRASDTNPRFHNLMHHSRKLPFKMINEVSLLPRAVDKATMHLEFLTHGINVPYTIILSPWKDNPKLHTMMKISRFKKLGMPFIIKPACGGGGLGVVIDAKTIHQIVKARMEISHDKYLLQEKIMPVVLGKGLNRKTAWFRAFYICGDVISCWWDTDTHIYHKVTSNEMGRYGLKELEDITRKIADICCLDFFSTEIAKIKNGKFIVVDYVNDMCDMRRKSQYPDAVPDDVVDRAIKKLVICVKESLAK